MIREKSAATDEENGQCIATVGDDVPRSSQDPSPQSYKAPDRVRVKTGEESEGNSPYHDVPICNLPAARRGVGSVRVSR